MTQPTTHPKPHQTAQHAPISSPLQAQSILAALFAIGPVYPLLDAVSLADPPMVFKILPPTPLVGIVLVPTTIPLDAGLEGTEDADVEVKTDTEGRVISGALDADGITGFTGAEWTEDADVGVKTDTEGRVIGGAPVE